MSAASIRQHAQMARALIKACGGLEEAAGVCRLSKSQLARFEDPREAAFFPVDVVAELELYCGQAIYSRALVSLFEAGRRGVDNVNLTASVCELAEITSLVQSHARRALADDEFSEAERRELTGLMVKVRRAVADVDGLTAREGDENG